MIAVCGAAPGPPSCLTGSKARPREDSASVVSPPVRLDRRNETGRSPVRVTARENDMTAGASSSATAKVELAREGAMHAGSAVVAMVSANASGVQPVIAASLPCAIAGAASSRADACKKVHLALLIVVAVATMPLPHSPIKTGYHEE